MVPCWDESIGIGDEGRNGSCGRASRVLASPGMRKIPWGIVVGVVGWWGLNALILSSHLLAFRTARGQPPP